MYSRTNKKLLRNIEKQGSTTQRKALFGKLADTMVLDDAKKQAERRFKATHGTSSKQLSGRYVQQQYKNLVDRKQHLTPTERKKLGSK